MADASTGPARLHADDERPLHPGTVGAPGWEEQVVHWTLRIAVFAEFVGHGDFGFITKAAWIPYRGVVGIDPSIVISGSLIARLGWFEIALGLVVLAWVTPGLLILVVAWKVGTELLRPLAGEPFWELVERGGSYAAPLALLYVRRWTVAPTREDPLIK